jgi:hypothetical protein
MRAALATPAAWCATCNALPCFKRPHLPGPIGETLRRIPNPEDIGVLNRFDPSPILDMAHFRVTQVGSLQRQLIQVRPRQRGSGQIGIRKAGTRQIASTQDRASQIGAMKVTVIQIGFSKNSLPQIRAGKIAAPKCRSFQSEPLQIRARDVNSHQRKVVMIEFLQSIDPAAIAAFSLRGVDHLPGLIVLFFQAVGSTREIKNGSKQNRKTPRILQQLQQRPLQSAAQFKK